MKINNFINRIFDIISKNLKCVKLAYEYKYSSNTHFIQIIPNSLLDNKEFKQLRAKFILEFIENNLGGSLFVLFPMMV